MPAVNPGPASTTTPNTQGMVQSQVPSSQTIVPTFASLPAATTVPAGTTAFTSDFGEVISTGAVWSFQGFQSTVGQARALFQSGLPLIIVPTSSAVSATGACTLGTTLPIVTGPFFGFFPANYLGTQQPTAGWYYGTITDSTHVQVYQNTYSATGVPAIPAVLQPWSGLSGGTPTGATGARTITAVVPANAMGPNGEVDIEYLASYNSSASNKTVSVAFGALSGPTTTATTTTSLGARLAVRNSGVTNVQITTLTTDSTYATSTQVLGYGAVDTTAAVNVVITINNAVATDFLILNSYSIKVYPA
jgi:hypothetical protein